MSNVIGLCDQVSSRARGLAMLSVYETARAVFLINEQAATDARHISVSNALLKSRNTALKGALFSGH